MILGTQCLPAETHSLVEATDAETQNYYFVIFVMSCLFRRSNRSPELLGLRWRKLHRGGDIQTESWERLRSQQAGKDEGVSSGQEEGQG